MKKVVKSNGKVEDFNFEKLFNSVQYSFLITKKPKGLSDDLTKKVLLIFRDWQRDKEEITSKDIRIKIGNLLDEIDPETAYIYKNFENII